MSLIVYFKVNRPFELYIRDSLATCPERKQNIFNFYLFSSSLSMKFEHIVNVSNTKTNFDSVLLPVHPSNHHLSSNSLEPVEDQQVLCFSFDEWQHHIIYSSSPAHLYTFIVFCCFVSSKRIKESKWVDTENWEVRFSTVRKILKSHFQCFHH